MSSRKLKVVGFKKEFLDCDDDSDYKSFFADMDAMYFKLKSSDWWATLHSESDESKWSAMLSEFLVDVGVNVEPSNSRKVIANAVLDVIIARKYDERKEAHHLTGSIFRDKEESLSAHAQRNQNPLNFIDYSSSEFATKVKDLCQLIGLADHPDPVVCLKAACIFISENLNKSIINERNAEQKSGYVPNIFELRSFPLDLPDQKQGSLNAAARILRLLNIEALRKTQTNVNETLVAIQNLTIDETKKPAVNQVKYGF
ncbi:hypothetical protein KIN20_002180 [Parelaphostrongylus tenuis]|uniref:Uncharacterized protein n=1 Tax=Parelaphostrongylus tenuis TaxID=148309 RepID=A0AAD5LXB8_PARTN|nr:hypothetical protein KIN20_002180 [Parelaphostrongylus tenuis]